MKIINSQKSIGTCKNDSDRRSEKFEKDIQKSIVKAVVFVCFVFKEDK